MYLSVIIPAYNEEQRIPATLEAIYKYLQQQPFDWEIVVVLDGSTDDTFAKVERFAKHLENTKNAGIIRTINRQQNRGKGFTVSEGMLAANGDIRLFTDADNSTDISHFDKMKPYFDQGYDVVIGSRDSKDAEGAQQAVPQTAFKRFLGNAGNLFIQLMAVPGIWDTQCGFKAFTATASKTIFPLATIDRWGIDIEILALAKKHDYKIAVIPTYWVNAEGSHVKTLDYFNTLWEAVKVRWNMMSGVYKKQVTV
jgi:dolichyl-phosphate beta-glucosyltransferase